MSRGARFNVSWEFFYNFFPTVFDVRNNLTKILLCLCWTLSVHSKNHKLDEIKSIKTMSKRELVANFRDYDAAYTWYSSLRSCNLSGGWVDVYDESNLISIIRKEFQE